jgi:hypothetical protein
MAFQARTKEDESNPFAYWQGQQKRSDLSEKEKGFADWAVQAEGQWTDKSPQSEERRGLMFRKLQQFEAGGDGPGVLADETSGLLSGGDPGVLADETSGLMSSAKRGLRAAAGATAGHQEVKVAPPSAINPNLGNRAFPMLGTSLARQGRVY